MEFRTLRRRLHLLSLWVLGITAILIVAGFVAHRQGWVVRSSPVSEGRLFFSPVGIGWVGVHDESGIAFPFFTRGGMNENIIGSTARSISMLGGPLAHYRVTEYRLMSGGRIEITNWRITYIPQVMLALILPIAGPIARTRRYWPALGVWEYDPFKSRIIQRLYNAITTASLVLFAVLIMLWGIANFMRGALPEIQLSAEREIWFEISGITLMRVDRHRVRPDIFTNPKTTAPSYVATRIRTVPYYAPAIVTLLLPLIRGSIDSLRMRKRARRLTAGHCPQCNYDLRMSEERCPECGTAFARKTIITLSN